MLISGRDKLVDFIAEHPNAKSVLLCWIKEIEDAVWSGSSCIRKSYPSVDFLDEGRVVFHFLKGGCKVMALPVYKSGVVRVGIVGTPAEFGKLDLE